MTDETQGADGTASKTTTNMEVAMRTLRRVGYGLLLTAVAVEVTRGPVAAAQRALSASWSDVVDDVVPRRTLFLMSQSVC